MTAIQRTSLSLGRCTYFVTVVVVVVLLVVVVGMVQSRCRFLPRRNKHTLTHSLTAVAGEPLSVSPTLLPPPVLAVVVGLVVDDGCTSRTHKIRIQRLPLELFAQIDYSSWRKTIELLLSESIGELVLMIADIWCVMGTSCAGSFRRDVASFGSFHATFSHM